MTDCSKHRITTEHGNIVLKNKAGKVLLITKDVSVETLVGLVAADKEGREYRPERNKEEA